MRKEIFLYIIISIILGLSIAFGMSNWPSSVRSEPEISLTDQFLTNIDERLLNIEKGIEEIIRRR